MITVYPELQRLIELKQCGWVFRPVHVDGELTLLAGWRAWLVDGWSDAIAIHDRDSARAYRCDGEGGTVWQEEDTLLRVIDKLLELPRPDAPDAPRLVIGKRQTLWVPGMGR